MKKFSLAGLVIIATIASSAVFANPYNNQGFGGYNGPSQGARSAKDVSGASVFSDDTPVVLTGFIIASLGGEMYRFQDASGTITVEIDNELWYGLNVTPTTRVTIWGEIDVEFVGGAKVDVDRIQIN